MANYIQAEPLMRRALQIDENSFGKDHPNVARDLNNLAALLKATNRLAEAEPLMRRALQILRNFEINTKYQHPYFTAVLQNYFGLLEAMTIPIEKIQQRLGSVSESKIDTIELVKYLNKKAVRIILNRQYEQAEPLLLKAVSIAEQFEENDKILLSSLYANLGVVYRESHRFDTAENYFLKVLHDESQKANMTNVSILRVQHHYAILLRYQNRLNDAENQAITTLMEMEKYLHVEHSWIMDAKTNLEEIIKLN